MTTERKHLLYFLTTEAQPSPFDINMAYDAGFHAVIPYGGVNEESAVLLVQDIIFSRGPKGAKFSALFIGGNDIESAERVRQAAAKSMFPPFQVSMMIDPPTPSATRPGSRMRQAPNLPLCTRSDGQPQLRLISS